MAMVLLIPLIVLSTLFTISSSTFSPQPRICYGQLGNNLPPPWKSVELIKSLKAKRVKIYYASPQILNSNTLKNATFQVSIMVPNKLISNISTIQTFSNHWVQNNVLPFYPHTVIRYLVGNEIISTTKNETWFKKIFIQHPNDSSSSTASKSDRAPEGPYCEWRPIPGLEAIQQWPGHSRVLELAIGNGELRRGEIR